MKQVIQNMRSGKTSLADIPPPQVGSGQILVATKASLISPGTERMVMEFAQKSLFSKAQERPDLVKKVIDKVHRDGLLPTARAVFSRLDEPLPLGYSAAGEVLAVGKNAGHRFQVGDRVVMAGAGYANHAELNAVPKNLVAPLPDDVPYEQGCFATLSAIAMQGLRNADVTLGDRVLVIGLGLVGQLTAQLLNSTGCHVMGMDFNEARLKLAVDTGISAAILPDNQADERVLAFTDEKGFDAIIICAATESDEPLQNATRWARDKANIVLTGKVGTQVPYADFMKKELNLVISRSYGPGRYDRTFEEGGQNYPIGFVRWTETENLAEAARMMSPHIRGTGRLQTDKLITHTYEITRAEQAYKLISSNAEAIGVVLTYPSSNEQRTQSKISIRPTEIVSGELGIGMIGAGTFASGVLLPALKGFEKDGIKFTGIMTHGGTKAAAAGEKFGFAYATGDMEELLADTYTKAVVIATRHDTHADMVCKALSAGKHVFVEKPLAVTREQLSAVEKAYASAGKVLMVGFNRRYAPFVQAVKDNFSASKGTAPLPRQIMIRVNAGQLETGTWQHDAAQGGGRLLGEGCHFIDLACHLAGSTPNSIFTQDAAGQDAFSLTIGFENGGLAQIFYTSEGDAAYSKERIEVFGSGKTAVIDNFREAFLTHKGKKTHFKTTKNQDKGHTNELVAFIRAVKGDASGIIAPESLFMTTQLTLLAEESRRAAVPIDVA